MNIFSRMVSFFTGTLNEITWRYFFLPCVLLVGIILTVKCGAVQFKHFGYAMKNTAGRIFEKRKAGKGAVTPFQAVTTALAATVGTGNIVGTSQALAVGGYGAIFWLWAAALLGMVIKYAEILLSVNYRRRDKKGDWVGGPMYYIEYGLGKRQKWLAAFFSLSAVCASLGIGNMSQVNSVVDSVVNAVNVFYATTESQIRFIKLCIGICLALLVGLILVGGIKRIGSVSERLIPSMSVLYIIATLTVIVCHAQNIGLAFAKIFGAAFAPRAVIGAASGITLKQAIVWGLRRSAFSNEAGLGSAAIAHAAAETESPVHQGLYGIFEVFIDTIVICTITALAIICSGVNIEWGTKPGTELVMRAFSTVFGSETAALFIAVSLALFAFSTVLGWALYGMRCVQYLFGEKAIRTYQIVFIIIIIIGCISPIDTVWNIADTFNGLMAIPNLIALLLLADAAAGLTEKHFSGNIT